MEDWTANLARKLLIGMQSVMEETVKEALSEFARPEKLAGVLQAMGVDMSRLAGQMSMGQAPNLDPYAVLGLDRSASDEQVRRAYRKIMSVIHPDKAGPELAVLSAMVNVAYGMIEKERGWR